MIRSASLIPGQYLEELLPKGKAVAGFCLHTPEREELFRYVIYSAEDYTAITQTGETRGKPGTVLRPFSQALLLAHTKQFPAQEGADGNG